MDYWGSLFAGYFYALVVGHIMIAWVVDLLWQQLGSGSQQATRPFAHHPKLVGVVERFLFLTALLVNQAEFIGVWLALKVAGQWKRWGEGIEDAGLQIPGRAFFNIFLLGSGLSVVFAATGWKIVQWSQRGRCYDVLALAVALALGVTLLRVWAGQYSQANDKGKTTAV